VVPGYQQRHFSRLAQRRFFGSEYRVTERCDRMGYRLSGNSVCADIEGIQSEGIAMGAIQCPADGQPIVLLNDRQTIGGYPKLGCVLSLDCAALAQLRPGDSVIFTPISEHAAHNALHLAHCFEQSRRLEPVP
jgi:allophanate hydrolase subunit 2